MRDGIQVGPGWGKPDRERELRVRCSDEGLVSGFHQGQQAYRLQQQAGYKTASLPTAKCKIYLYSGRRPYKRLPRLCRHEIASQSAKHRICTAAANEDKFFA